MRNLQKFVKFSFVENWMNYEAKIVAAFKSEKPTKL